MKKVIVLGSTGSIGRQTLDIIRKYPKKFKLTGISGHKNLELLASQAKEFRPKYVFKAGDNLVDLATVEEADIVVVALSGMSALLPTIAAIKAKKRICLANKEVLVVAGGLIMDLVRKSKAEIIPIDSEISAIFQCLQGQKISQVKKLIITMGKGKLAKMDKDRLRQVTIADVNDRPAWDLGQKISVDSATGINKSFEVIEASRFFNLPSEKIEIIVHPEYFCHSLVEFNNGSILGEFGLPDMRRYIQYSLFYPDRIEMPRLLRRYAPRNDNNSEEFSLVGKTLTFEAPPYAKFPCLKLGYDCLLAAGTMPAVMHGADETAVFAFLDKKIKFTEIFTLIEKVMVKHKVIKNPSLSQIIKAEKWGREEAYKNV